MVASETQEYESTYDDDDEETPKQFGSDFFSFLPIWALGVLDAGNVDIGDCCTFLRDLGVLLQQEQELGNPPTAERSGG